MMTPSRKLYYAVEAVIYIAYHADTHPVSSRDIARMQGLPARHLEQIMQRLVHGRVLRGMRGPRGGYLLAKPAGEITLAQICALVNDDDTINSTPDTTHIGTLILRPFWTRLHQEIHTRLDAVTVADLCSEATAQNLPRILPARLASGFANAILVCLIPLYSLSHSGVPYA